jgi:hypothetical protein
MFTEVNGRVSQIPATHRPQTPAPVGRTARGLRLLYCDHVKCDGEGLFRLAVMPYAFAPQSHFRQMDVQGSYDPISERRLP